MSDIPGAALSAVPLRALPQQQTPDHRLRALLGELRAEAAQADRDGDGAAADTLREAAVALASRHGAVTRLTLPAQDGPARATCFGAFSLTVGGHPLALAALRPRARHPAPARAARRAAGAPRGAARQPVARGGRGVGVALAAHYALVPAHGAARGRRRGRPAARGCGLPAERADGPHRPHPRRPRPAGPAATATPRPKTPTPPTSTPWTSTRARSSPRRGRPSGSAGPASSGAPA